MSLILRFTLLFLLVAAVVFAIGGMITKSIMQREIDLEQRRFLEERLTGVLSMIERREPETDVLRGKLIIRPLSQVVPQTEPFFSDTLVMHSTLNREEPHMKLSVTKTVNSRSYHIVMFDLIVEQDDIEDIVTESLLKTFVILLIATAALAYLVFYFQLKPFRNTLQVIREFRLDSDTPVYQKTTVREFDQLNTFLTEMTEKLNRDFLALKEFSENASHEMQTPLAIIQGKIDLLLQNGGLSGQQMEWINSIQSTVKRLSHLNNSLSILAKIDNQEFSDERVIEVRDHIEPLLEELTELISLKGLEISKELQSDLKIKIDPILFQVLVSNLLTNAIRHNSDNGKIKVALHDVCLSVSNTGRELEVEPQVLFQRFKKSEQRTSGMGLGLAIVKKICDQYGFRLVYDYDERTHKISIYFRPA